CGNSFEVKLSHSTYIQCCSIICGAKFKQQNFDNKLKSQIGITIKDWLVKHYINQCWVYSQICKELHINARTLMRYMRQYSIPIRNPSEAVKLQWIRNPKKAESLLGIPHPTIRGDNNPAKRPSSRLKNSLSKRGNKNPMFNILGKDNPCWKGGKMTLRGKGWNSIKTQVKRRDNNICQECGSTEKLEVHHIVTYRNKKNFNKLTNLVTLCHNCHVKQLSHKL
ncbi:MAG: HNH endonuclease, partial [Ignavibacteria bacterium]|nr:HNH endonuclease [Ignavibacteria bacterium]